MSKFQKRRHRLRMRAVDSVVDTVNNALAKQGQTLPAVERWLEEMPREEEMRPKDKYTMFDRKAKRYRKSVHSTSILLCWPYLFLLDWGMKLCWSHDDSGKRRGMVCSNVNFFS